MLTFHFNTQKYAHGLLLDLDDVARVPGKHSIYFSEIHTADFYEILFIKTGFGELQLDDTRISLQDNMIIFISPFQKRQWFIEQSEHIAAFFGVFRIDFFAIFFTDSLFVYRLQYFHNSFQELTLHLGNTEVDKFLSIFSEMRNEIQKSQPDSEHILRALLYYSLILLNRLYAKQFNISAEIKLNNHAYLFKQAVEKNIKTKQTVDEYARLLQISRVTLNQAVKKQFGTTASKIIYSRLICEIKKELLFSSKNITEIADELNFSETNNLTRFFKAHTQQTPLEFRTKHLASKK